MEADDGAKEAGRQFSWKVQPRWDIGGLAKKSGSDLTKPDLLRAHYMPLLIMPSKRVRQNLLKCLATP